MNDLPENPSAATVLISIRCPLCGDRGAFELSQRAVRENSRVLQSQLDDLAHGPAIAPRHLNLQCSGRDFDCPLLESIVCTWKQSKHIRVDHPRVTRFRELQQLAHALWEFQCSPRWFEAFARDVRAALWDEHPQTGAKSPAWAFIAVVFGWRDVFGLAAMDIPELGDEVAQPQYRWPFPFERSVPRNIVPPASYRAQLSLAYNFVRDACCKLEYDPSQRALSARVRACFAHHRFRILLPEEDNSGPLRDAGAAGLLRLFEDFLQRPSYTAAAAAQDDWEHPSSPQSRRFPHQPVLWRKIPRLIRRLGAAGGTSEDGNDGPVAEEQLTQLSEFRYTEFQSLLSRTTDIGNRFEYARNTQLILNEGLWHGSLELPPREISELSATRD